MRKYRAGGITSSDFRLYYKATVIKTVWYWHKNRHINERNRIDSPEINSNMYSQMIFNKGANNIQWGKKYSFSQMMLGNLDTHMPKNEDEPLAYTIYKN